MTTRKPPSPTPAKRTRSRSSGTPIPRKGGARPGAGRPKKVDEIARIAAAVSGALPTTRTMRKKQRAVAAATAEAVANRTASAAERAYDGDIYGALKNGELDPKATPLDVMIEAMRQAYKIGGAIMAAPFAKEAAPYVHGKINNIDLKQTLHPGQAGQGGQAVQDIGLDRFLVEYVDTVEVEAKEVPDGTSSD